MGQYTDAEKQIFRDKELRIVRQAILKKLIEKLPLEDIYGVTKVIDLTEKYVNHVYSERNDNAKRGQVGGEADSAEPIRVEWEQLAKGLNLAIPNSQNIKILNQVVDEYKKAYKASDNPVDILVHILNTFGKYPAKTESVEKIVESLNERLEK